MGTYINPGAVGFSAINTRNYVDKTMLIDLINSTVGSEQRLACISRPRRFGKSYAARMLSAYYDVSCDSHLLFDDKKIAATENYERYINKYNVNYRHPKGMTVCTQYDRKRPVIRRSFH